MTAATKGGYPSGPKPASQLAPPSSTVGAGFTQDAPPAEPKPSVLKIFGNDVERLHLGPGEVLIVRPKLGLSRDEREILLRNIARVCDTAGIDRDRIVVLDRDVDLTVVKADQMELAPDDPGKIGVAPSRSL